MRVISGKYKGKLLDGFDLEGTRPTKDRVKESVFGSIQNKVKNSIFLDLFAGSGSIGIEALSSSIGEEVTTIEDVYEPYLLQVGLLKRTSRGRVVTDKAYEVLGIEKH